MSVMSVPLDTKMVFPIDDAPDATSPLERAFDRGADALYRFILVRVARRRDVADDLLQQTCCIAFQQNRVFADDDECESWMRGIARNLVKAHWRSVKKHNGRIDLEDAKRAGVFAPPLRDELSIPQWPDPADPQRGRALF